MDETLGARIDQIVKQIEALDADTQLKVLSSFDQPVVDKTKTLGSTGLTVGDAEILQDLRRESAKVNTDSYLTQLEGFEPNKQGIAGFQKRDLSARDKDRWLTGGMAESDMLQRIALINKL